MNKRRRWKAKARRRANLLAVRHGLTPRRITRIVASQFFETVAVGDRTWHDPWMIQRHHG